LLNGRNFPKVPALVEDPLENMLAQQLRHVLVNLEHPLLGVAGVAAEQLVAAVACKDFGHPRIPCH
jgi:hypothetical protein